MKLLERLHRMRFNRVVRAVQHTPVVACQPGGVVVLSMVHHRDVLSYLLALKSFVRYVPAARVVLVADPTLNQNDRAVLRAQVPSIEIREAAEFRHDGVPTGGCWERLCAIAEYVADGYVIQLDADTVAVAPLPEVRQAVNDGVSFTLGTEDDQRVGPADETASWARKRLAEGDHIQLAAEALLDQLEPKGSWRYVRGCAGFAGFARNSITPARVVEVSRQMGRLLGPRWAQWGTEQFTSNLLVASSEGGRVLPHPQYCAPHHRRADSAFFHFIGYVRFSNGLYARTASRVCSELTEVAHAA